MGQDPRSDPRGIASGITRDDWLKALSDVGWDDTNDRSAVTRKEFAAMMQIDIKAAIRRLDFLVEHGLAELTQKREADVRGRMNSVIAYRLIPDAKAPARRRARGQRG